VVLVCFLITSVAIRNALLPQSRERRLPSEWLIATSELLLRLEIRMRRVLLELGEILNSDVLRLEIW